MSKIVIRKGAFETNSSSTHAINIFRGSNYDIPEKITIRPGEFGWDCEVLRYPEDKLSYLYTWCLEYGKEKDYQYRIKSKLEAAGVKEVVFCNGSGWWEDGYIDHSSNLREEDLETIFETYFLDFVFNHQSYIETGNDNGDYDVDEDPNADWSIYKGN